MKNEEVHRFNSLWQIFKRRIQDQWNLTDAELERSKRNMDDLCNLIVFRSNESRISVQNYVDNLWFEIFVRGSKRSLRHASWLTDRRAARRA